MPLESKPLDKADTEAYFCLSKFPLFQHDIELAPEMKYTNGVFQELGSKRERREEANTQSTIKWVPSEIPAVTTVPRAGALLGEKREQTLDPSRHSPETHQAGQ